MARLYCGTSGWNYPHWREILYPVDVPQRKWLEYYSESFDTVEVNNSFYRLPEIGTFEKWRDQTPPGFTFAVKASRYMTHIKRLKEPEEPLQRLLSRTVGLRDKHGPILYQLPPNLKVDLERLEAFLKLLPSGMRHVFEFRNDTWQVEAVWDLLRRYDAAYCVMSSPGLPLHLVTTAGFSYLRMHSGGEDTNGNYEDDHLAEWADRVKALLMRGDVYVYFNNDAHGFAINNALTLKRLVLS